jgi:GTPase SAR1 family protein
MRERLNTLEKHLQRENPVLSQVIRSFRSLDRTSRKLGFFSSEQSFANRTPWWPLIAVLGTYSSGKSTFINHYLEHDLQSTGTQAVDDKFTVICYSSEAGVRVLPGMALDSDPRFPLYRIGRTIREVAPEPEQHVDAYLQLKTCPCRKLRGTILIDSPGFDADAQRASTLRITDRIIDLSDMVLVFFDARHPEAGSMQDTLQHLVKATLQRRDSNKFLYILNQIDVTAQEDNPEQVFAAWQRSLAQSGLLTGRYYAIYNPDVAVPIRNEEVRKRFERKRDTDLSEILHRIEQVKVQRAYRIVGMLEESAHFLEQEVVPRLRRFTSMWRRRVLLLEAGLGLALLTLFLVLTIRAGYWNGLHLELPLPPWLASNAAAAVGAGIVLLLAGWLHFLIRSRMASRVRRKLLADMDEGETRSNFERAMRRNSRWWRSIWLKEPSGWNRRTRKLLDGVLDDANGFIQKLNDLYTDPSGEGFAPSVGSRAGETGTVRMPGSESGA